MIALDLEQPNSEGQRGMPSSAACGCSGPAGASGGRQAQVSSLLVHLARMHWINLPPVGKNGAAGIKEQGDGARCLKTRFRSRNFHWARLPRPLPPRVENFGLV